MSNIDYPASTLRICLDQTDTQGRPCPGGRILGVAVDMPYPFYDGEEMILQIDRLLDHIGRPQSSKRLRSFGRKPHTTSGYCGNPIRYYPGEVIRRASGIYRTIDVYFLSRLRGTWQGFLRFHDTDTSIRFESELELLSLIFYKEEDSEDGSPADKKRSPADEKESHIEESHIWNSPVEASILSGIRAGQQIYRRRNGTFVIEKKFTQHGTWQGIVHWIEADRTLPFRSALELLRIVYSVKEKTPPAGQEYPERPDREEESYE